MFYDWNHIDMFLYIISPWYLKLILHPTEEKNLLGKCINFSIQSSPITRTEMICRPCLKQNTGSCFRAIARVRLSNLYMCRAQRFCDGGLTAEEQICWQGGGADRRVRCVRGTADPLVTMCRYKAFELVCIWKSTRWFNSSISYISPWFISITPPSPFPSHKFPIKPSWWTLTGYIGTKAHPSPHINFLRDRWTHTVTSSAPLLSFHSQPSGNIRLVTLRNINSIPFEISWVSLATSLFKLHATELTIAR